MIIFNFGEIHKLFFFFFAKWVCWNSAWLFKIFQMTDRTDDCNFVEQLTIWECLRFPLVWNRLLLINWPITAHMVSVHLLASNQNLQYRNANLIRGKLETLSSLVCPPESRDKWIFMLYNMFSMYLICNFLNIHIRDPFWDCLLCVSFLLRLYKKC